MTKLTDVLRVSLPQVWKGAAMGVAEVIPGVSGGTIAFITGIYERLIRSIRAFGPELMEGWKKGGWRGAWLAIDGNFLLGLLLGMAAGVVFGVFAITWVLDHYPVMIWAFFFGLILGSVLFVGKRVRTWTMGPVTTFLAGTALAFFITVASPAQGNEALWYVFLSGMIAICALILPGISGSFILLLMGMYTYIIPTVKNALRTLDPDSLLILVTFGSGAVIGLAVFSRVLTWTFNRFHDGTMALLTGFMLGSLNKVWPWRNVLEYRVNSKGEEVPFIEKSVWPGQFDGDPYLFWAILFILVGLLAVYLLEHFGQSPGKNQEANGR